MPSLTIILIVLVVKAPPAAFGEPFDGFKHYSPKVVGQALV